MDGGRTVTREALLRGEVEVTITLGPKALRQLEMIAAASTKPGAFVLLRPEDFIGAAVTTYLHTGSRALGLPVVPGLLTHFD
jgi:hypothetical protein